MEHNLLRVVRFVLESKNGHFHIAPGYVAFRSTIDHVTVEVSKHGNPSDGLALICEKLDHLGEKFRPPALPAPAEFDDEIPY